MLFKYRILVGSLGIVVLFWTFSLSNPLFQESLSTVVYSSEGQLIGARIAADEQWRFPASKHVPERFAQCLIYFEDEYFYTHPGFNPFSILKATHANIFGIKKRGASTISQQVIRLTRKNKNRSYTEKFIELFLATRLEAGYSKDSILNLYTSNAPFGGNVVGLQAAAWRYFGIPAEDLSWGQSAALAVLPNAPAMVFPGKNQAVFKQKRDFLLKKLKDKSIIDDDTYQLALQEALPGKPEALPDLAPHYTEFLKNTKKGETFETHINYQLQKQLHQITADYYFHNQQKQIHNLAIVVQDVNSRAVIAYIGNAPTTAEHHKFVDVALSNRSTGSVLKPLLYAAALQEGLILPHSLLADIPTSIDGYQPKNFEKQFKGALPATEALSRSLNIPAVLLLKNYGLQRFYNQLQKIGLHSIKQEPDHYGLTLILGGAESNLLEITNVYASMAATLNYYTKHSAQYRNAEFNTPKHKKSSVLNFGFPQSNPQVFAAGAIHSVFESLRATNRPAEEEYWELFQNAKPLAWKTGTSYGFKDAWAIGVNPDYAIGV
ncbi:MAG: penicillin-binding protein 1C, partial [Flavobacteriaceae bacterium]|nr:penicillin-binding protein 1C [Flavobacteriaceae bacterium]